MAEKGDVIVSASRHEMMGVIVCHITKLWCPYNKRATDEWTLDRRKLEVDYIVMVYQDGEGTEGFYLMVSGLGNF